MKTINDKIEQIDRIIAIMFSTEYVNQEQTNKVSTAVRWVNLKKLQERLKNHTAKQAKIDELFKTKRL